MLILKVSLFSNFVRTRFAVDYPIKSGNDEHLLFFTTQILRNLP